MPNPTHQNFVPGTCGLLCADTVLSRAAKLFSSPRPGRSRIAGPFGPPGRPVTPGVRSSPSPASLLSTPSSAPAGGAICRSPLSRSRAAFNSACRPSNSLSRASCSNGLPDFPDPNANGQGFGNQEDANQEQSNPHFGTAYSDCRHLLPSAPSSHGKVIPSNSQLVRFAQCMRSRGVPNYPDPNPNGGLGAALAQLGINPNSPQFQATLRTCNRLVPMPSQRGGS